MTLFQVSWLASPFDGFKSEMYFYEIARNSSIFYNNSWFNSNNLWWEGGSFMQILIVFVLIFLFYSNLRKMDNLSIWGSTIIKTFFVSVIILAFTFLGNSNYMLLGVLEHTEYGLNWYPKLIEIQSLMFSFPKDVLAFVMILIGVYLYGSKSFTNLFLFTKGGMDALGEFLYRFNLDLFASSLDLKKDKEIQQYQEFFLKVNSVFLFVLGSNLVGMVPYALTITSSLANTFFIALAIFINIWILMFREKGVNYFFSLFLPKGCPLTLVLLLVPIEVLSYSFRLVSLSVRLFANMLAGHTLIKVVAGFSWSLLLLGDVYVFVHYVPVIILFGLFLLEFGVAFIQAYVFIVLSYLYIRDIFAAH